MVSEREMSELVADKNSISNRFINIVSSKNYKKLQTQKLCLFLEYDVDDDDDADGDEEDKDNGKFS